ncbi:MAG: alanine racemase [Patescibacteria group bacterium]
MKDEIKKGLRTWIDIDTEAIRHNFSLFRGSISDDVELCSVVKSNAYGHCLFDFSKQMEDNGVDRLAVDSFPEGLRLRKEGIKKPIVILGYTLPFNFNKAADSGISITIAGKENLKALFDYKGEKEIKIHLKFDTGMNRQGFKVEETPSVIKLLKEVTGKRRVKVEGLYTHFADAKEPSHVSSTKKQIEAFERVRVMFQKAGFNPIVHASATAGMLNFKEGRYDMIRIGAGMYGIWPSGATKHQHFISLPILPVLSWRTRVADVKRAKSGSAFGYAFTETVSRDTDFAVLPIGYWHGFRRSLSSVGHVLIKGKRAKVLGLVSMDITVVDVTDIKDVREGDTVTLIGRDGEDEISVEEMAKWAGITNYEMITGINPLIKRIY